MVIGTAYAGDQSNGVDNKQLIDINEIIRFSSDRNDWL